MPKKFERSPLTERLVKYLGGFDKGTEITYAELSRNIGAHVTSRTANLEYAKKLLQREQAQVWVAVRNKGIRRFTDAETAKRLPDFHLRGARGKLKRGGDQAELVDTKQLDIDEQARFGIDCLQRKLASEALSRSARTRLTKLARGNSNDLPEFNVLEWALPLRLNTLRKKTT